MLDLRGPALTLRPGAQSGRQGHCGRAGSGSWQGPQGRRVPADKGVGSSQGQERGHRTECPA